MTNMGYIQLMSHIQVRLIWLRELKGVALLGRVKYVRYGGSHIEV